MPTTTEVKFLPDHEDDKQATTRHHRNNVDIRLFYFKTAIVVLSVSLVVVLTILVWQLVSDHACRKATPAAKLDVQEKPSPELNLEKDFNECQWTEVTTTLPSSLPRNVENVLESVRESLKQEVNKNSLVAVSSSAIFHSITVWKTAFGVTDKSSKRTPDENTLYRTGSLVKILTTLMTYKLLQDTKINCLDDAFHKYAPTFAVQNPFNNDAITIRQILSHTSGLPREVPCGPLFSSQRQNICPVNTTYVYQQLKNMELKFAPGTAVGYSNLGYALLAHALFKRFGLGYPNWREWIRMELLSSLEIVNTVLGHQRSVGNTAVNYKDNGVVTPELDWGWSSPSFQMSTSTSDLTKLVISLLDTKTSLFHDIVQEMFKPVFIFPDFHTIFTTGFQVHTHNSLQVVSKAGVVPGSSAAIFLIPEANFGFVVLATGKEIAPRLVEDISKKISKAFASSSIISASPEIRPPPRPHLYSGNYVLQNKWSDEVRATILFKSYHGRLELHQTPGYPNVVYLTFKNVEILQIIYPRGLSCQTYALGQHKELLTFSHPDRTRVWQQFTLGSFLFQRVH